MAETVSDAKSETNTLLWYAGWHGLHTLVGVTVVFAVIGNYLDMPYLLGTVGFMFGAPILWFVGTRHINGNYEDVLDGFKNEVDKIAKEFLSLENEQSVSTYKILGSKGSKFLISPDKTYEQMTMVVTDYSIVIHDEADLDMVGISEDIGKSTEEIYYDNVSSVNYEDGEFWINRSDGHGHSWPSERKPDDALDDIQRRVREYKRSAA